MATEDWTEAKVLALLEERYPSARGEWAFFTHLRGHTGYSTPGRESYLDAFAINCWPSKNFVRHAIEVKVSRSDWLRELKDPGKRQRGMELAHEFWFVAPSGIIKKGEVPEGCGWLDVIKGGFRTKLAAKHREVADPPIEFVASLLRAAQQPLTARETKAFRLAGRDMTVEEFLKESDTLVQTSASHRARGMLRELRAELPEMKLSATVRQAMGRGYYGVPSPDDFRAWLESITGFPGGVSMEPLEALREALRATNSAAYDLRRALLGRGS